MIYWVVLLLTIFTVLRQFGKVVHVVCSVNSSSGKNAPSGPFGVPVLGFMPFLAINPQKVLQLLGNYYGSVFTIFLGRYRVVVLNDYKVIKEALREDGFSGRPDLRMLEVRNRCVHKGLVCSQGKDWLEQRKFTIRQLKDFGFGKQSMECLIQEELDETISGIRKHLDKSISLQARFNLAILNTIWRITCGERYNHDDDRLKSILKKTGADLAETQYTGPILFLPWLIRLAPGLTRWKEFTDSVESVHTFLHDIVESHKNTFNSSSIRDFTDSYLSEIERTTDPDSSFYGKTGEHSLQVVLLDLFMAGGDTTSTTLSWAFLYITLYPNIQEKVQQEIDIVIGNQKPCLGHRKQMPYAEATIMEVLRRSSLVPMGLFHSTTQDIKFRNYDIPKDTVIMANLHNVHMNKIYWKDPENFRPERFLDTNYRIIKHEAFMPFSTGKRICPGESLARDQLFIFFVGLLQRFKFIPDPALKRPSIEPLTGVIFSPRPYRVLVRERGTYF